MFDPIVTISGKANGNFDVQIKLSVPNTCYSKGNVVVGWPQGQVGIPEEIPIQLFINLPPKGVMCGMIVFPLEFDVQNLNGAGHSWLLIYVVVGTAIHPPIRVPLVATI